MSNEEDNTDAIMADLDALMNEFETAVADDPDVVSGFIVGAVVEGNYHGGDKWYKGKIEQCNGDGTVDIKYLDGEREQNMPRDYVKVLEDPAAVAAARAANVVSEGTTPTSSLSPKKLHAPISSPSPEKLDSKSGNGNGHGKAGSVGIGDSSAGAFKASVTEDEIQVMNEDEIRQLSRNTTEDRNISTSIIVEEQGGSVKSSPAKTSNNNSNKTKQSPFNTTPKRSHAAAENNYDAYKMDTGVVQGQEDDFAEAFDALDHYDEHEDDEEEEEEMYQSHQSSDFNPDGSLKRKPYQSKLQKPIIKSGKTTISLSQAKLFGLTNYKGAQPEVDPDIGIKQTLKRINNLTRNPPKDLSYIKSEDDIESTFRPKRSAEAKSAMNNPACGYDFIDRLEQQENGFLERTEAGQKGGGKLDKIIRDQAEGDYEASMDKLGCPKCKRYQSFDEFWDKKRSCQLCEVRYVKVNVSSGVGFERRMKIADERRRQNLKKAADDMYLYKPVKHERPKDDYGTLRADMQDLFLAIYEPKDENTVYLQDEDMTLSAIAKLLRASPNYLLLSKKIQKEMTMTAITSFLEMDSLFKQYVKYDPKSKKNVLTEWRVSPDWSNPLDGGIAEALNADQVRLRKEQMLSRASASERESKKKAERDRKQIIKPSQRLEVSVDENEAANKSSSEGKERESKEIDQKFLLKQLAQLNAEKANLLNQTLLAAEVRKKENEEFVAATKNSINPRAVESKKSNGSGGGGARKGANVAAEQESKRKASRDGTKVAPKGAAKKAPTTAAESGDKFDALLDF